MKWPVLGCGVGLRARHYRDFLQQKQAADWLEVNSENYFGRGGLDLHVLQQLRRDYDFSLHGIGLGLGSVHGFSTQHLAKLAELTARIEPALVSDHLCWGAVQGRDLNDLLPLPFSQAALHLVCSRVQQVQDLLRRPILLENVSTYLRFAADEWGETAFLAEVVRRTGCGVLLDVNNLYVNQYNHGEDALAAIAALPLGCVAEIHLAGHLVQENVLIDHHGDVVAEAVWALYRAALARFGPVSSMIEWDTDIPELPILLQQAALARQQMAEMMPPQASAPVVASGQSGGRDLGELQASFAQALLDPTQTTQLLPSLVGVEEHKAERFALYRGNLHANWSKTLSAAYPVLKQLVGEEFFDALAREYGRVFPSTSADLNRFGAHFAEFLQDFPHVAEYPYFPDMARLEWALQQAYYAADASPVSAQDIAALAPAQLDASYFALHPACHLLQSPWAVVELWQAHQSEPVAEFPDPMQQTTYALITRAQWHPQLVGLSQASFVALSALQAGQSLGDALDAALEVDEDFQFIDNLQLWLGHAVLLPAKTLA